MPRAPFQILVIPFRRTQDGVRYALFHRADSDMWQWISGGGEDDESPMDAAVRESFEEGGIDRALPLLSLDAIASIPIEHFVEREHWAPTLHVIPEYSFAVEVDVDEITLSAEHRAVEWMTYDEAYRRARWDSNRVALYELRRRLGLGSDPLP